MGLNTPQSKQGNLVRYGVYLFLYLIVIACKTWGLWGKKLHIAGEVFFILISLGVLYFYIRQYNHEQRYFEQRFSLPLLADYGFTIGMSILVIVSRFIVSYLQAQGHLATAYFQLTYAESDSKPLFWFLIFCIGLLLPVLQIFLSTGFFFNYYFRSQDLVSAIAGIIFSGIFFGVLNFQFSISLLVINSLSGMLFAWAYMYTQTIAMPIYLAVLNGMFMVVLA
ncbi:membrane protease YdiL (CAAX protease family) [Lactobacillus colini]|uniref:Membrane protease YdiL (CAAX protease family) n=1 Tax=Lactobacillus colini TaxID=1819254 RepID=A0ABS4MCD8_9LACO|nr:CPBP family intramembrane glutamic endopeptidase [Lactobacillus colini]MBP2057350.1 membrane protease YdiL (CAAX protease family) [Lactobacillus colini]